MMYERRRRLFQKVLAWQQCDACLCIIFILPMCTLFWGPTQIISIQGMSEQWLGTYWFLNVLWACFADVFVRPTKDFACCNIYLYITYVCICIFYSLCFPYSGSTIIECLTLSVTSLICCRLLLLKYVDCTKHTRRSLPLLSMMWEVEITHHSGWYVYRDIINA